MIALIRHALLAAVCFGFAFPNAAAHADSLQENTQAIEEIPESGLDLLPVNLRYKINALIADQMAASHIAGLSLAIVHHGKTEYVKGFGISDIETQKRVTARTRFEIGSETKSFTALALMRIYDDPSLIKKAGVKRLDLDKPVTAYLSNNPDFSLPLKWQGITVRELLAMASGIEDFPSAADTGTYTWQQIITQEVGPLDLKFYPGTGYCYSNPGYMLLGEVIQQLTEMNYGDFMQQFVFEPLRMSNSAIHLDKSPPNVATGYVWQGNGWTPANYRPGSWSFSAGAMITSAVDLAQFLKAVDKRRLVEASAYDLMGTRSQFYTYKGQTPWGLGFQVSVLDSPQQSYKILRKDGGLPGYNAQIYIDVLNEVSVALSTNTNNQGLATLAAQISAVVAGLSQPIDPPGTGGNCWVPPA